MDSDLGWIASNKKEHTPETNLPQSFVQYFYHCEESGDWVLDPDMKVTADSVDRDVLATPILTDEEAQVLADEEEAAEARKK